MQSAEFETLAGKVEQAVTRIEELKREVAGKDVEIERLREEIEAHTGNVSRAGERVRDLVTRLDAVLA
jgi:predicted  nucleic acid-binding Zn-ribbon protein